MVAKGFSVTIKGWVKKAVPWLNVQRVETRLVLKQKAVS
jgi:hypothetical protein